MKKTQAEKVSKVITEELNKLCDKYDASTKEVLEDLWKESDKTDRMFNISIEESEYSKGHFGVRVATDSDVYNIFYEYNDISDANRKNVQSTIDKALGKEFTDEQHYFEQEGAGVVLYF